MSDAADTFDTVAMGVPDEIRSSRTVVMKYGGSSVASRANWDTIRDTLRQRLDSGLNVVLVHSALAGVSDRLAALLREAERGGGEGLVAEIRALHGALADAMGLDGDALLSDYFTELDQLSAGLRLVREVTPRMEARVMALGELMATTLSAAWLSGEGLPVHWRDAREFMRSEPGRHRSERQHFLSAICPATDDAELRGSFAETGGVCLTQGFIAADSAGETVLLGRGGSDTSAAYLAARLGACRLEIWSDVPGVFTADPRIVPNARLLHALHYDEAQEIASTGGSVLHPRCIPPLRRRGIPLFLRCTADPSLAGTTVSPATADGDPLIKALSLQRGITLISLEGIAMWQEAGFMADAFAVFARRGVSVDLVSTSESNVTVSIDTAAGEIGAEVLADLVGELEGLARVRVLSDCAALSLVGQRVRAILHKIGPAMAVFEEEHVYLVSQAANDLNLSFVVDDDQAYRLIQRLHTALIGRGAERGAFGPTWQELNGEREAPALLQAWWRDRAGDLLGLMDGRTAAYAYDLKTVRAAADRLTGMRHIDSIFYAMKANPNDAVLRTLHEAGINFECVSPGELERVFELFPDLATGRVLFTPNFAGRDEYAQGLARGVHVTLDNLYPLRHWPELFRDDSLFVRLDPGKGRGHHEHVRTAGTHTKFGIPLFELDELQSLVESVGCRVVGVHAHSGSGILDPANWEDIGETLASAAERFPGVEVLDLGGGLGIPERSGEEPLDLSDLDARLGALKARFPGYRFWLEPGRYLVAEAGVLLARVTQLKGKGELLYVGIATGMNSLIRPALYGAYHEIVNLSRLGAATTRQVTVVGPICESADRLGSDRSLPDCAEGDVLLIANAGAYGRAMASRYNLRDPAPELTL
ncbi:MAG: bifunctional aspartate kinase/diaminopimelate decarboxylase [Pseudomonadota bacterium]